MTLYDEPVFVSAQKYYPFGMMMRQASTGKYRYRFNGKENDNEVKGLGNQQDYGLRIYDSCLGKFLSVDPLTKDYPWYTPYQFAGNQPIWATDLDGMEPSYAWQDNRGIWHETPAGDNLPRKNLPSGHEQFIKRGITSTTPGDQNQQFTDFLDWVPWLNEVKGIDQAITGKEWFTGRELSTTERAAGLIPYAGKAKGILRAGERNYAKSVAKKAVQEEIKSKTDGQAARANSGSPEAAVSNTSNQTVRASTPNSPSTTTVNSKNTNNGIIMKCRDLLPKTESHMQVGTTNLHLQHGGQMVEGIVRKLKLLSLMIQLILKRDNTTSNCIWIKKEAYQT